MSDKQVAIIVEDDELTANMFAVAVQDAGFQPVILYDGQEVASYLRKYHSDLLILDLLLPEYPGVDVIRDVRNDNSLKDVKIIAISADANTAEMVRDDVDIVLVKPVGYVQLRDLAERFLYHREEG